METTTTIKHQLSPEQLAEALASATPEEFSQFWFAFAGQLEKVDPSEARLLQFARAMTRPEGSRRRQVLERLVELTSYVDIRRALGDKDN